MDFRILSELVHTFQIVFEHDIECLILE